MGALRETLSMLRHERRMGVVLATVAQSAVGTGAAYVALLLVAYDRWESPWAISLILFAEFAPAMLLGPLFGAAADRWPRRWCLVGAELLRACAFVSVIFTDSFVLTLALALAAGTGAAMFRPAMLASLTGLVREDRLPAATSAYGVTTEGGLTLGPALAAGLLLFMDPAAVVVANGATFLVSTVVLSRVPIGQVAALPSNERRSLVRETRDGLVSIARLRPIAILIALGGAAMISGGIFNVIELPFAQEHLGATDSGYSALVSIYGLGFFVGSVGGAAGGDASLLRRRFIQGLFVTGVASLAIAAASGLVLGLMTFALAGFGNGLFATYQRLLIQDQVDGRLHGRAFGLDDAVSSWALASALLAGGVITSLWDTRTLMIAVGAWELGVAIAALVVLRSLGPPTSARDTDLLGQADLGEQDPNVLAGSGLRL